MPEWWDGAVCYQVYPRSFADSDGDGIGDLRGITAHLDHLEWLGIDAIWLSPTFPSPNVDWGYDVADYRGVHCDLGTPADLDTLIHEAGARGIRILLDLVPNHTSIEHPWFEDARSSRTAAHRDWYVWADPSPDGSPPNNWVSSFLGPAWTLDERTGQMFLHNFLPEQPDLNWWNDDVRAEFDEILRHWFDRGIAGFRIDVMHMVVKDRLLRDNPPTDATDHWFDQLRGQRQTYNACQPETHDVIRRWRAVGNAFDPERLFVGETHVFDLEQVASFYGDGGDGLQLAFNFPFLHAPFDAGALAGVVAETEAVLPAGSVPCWTIGNHDKMRFPTRWCAERVDRVRCALLLLLGLRGTTFLYYGDELGLADADVPVERLVDPVSIDFHAIGVNRDAARTPMPWSGAPGAGFTAPGIEPWLPFGDIAACNVADQRDDPESTLHLVRDLIALRRELVDLHYGAYVPMRAEGGVWAWRRGDTVVCAVNLADGPATVDAVSGTIRVCTERGRDGEHVRGALSLGPWEGAVVVA